MVTMLLSELASAIGATLKGESDKSVTTIAPFDQAREGELTFIAQTKYLSKLDSCQASILIASPDMNVEAFVGDVLYHPNPYLAYAKTAQLLHPAQTLAPEVHASAIISDTAVLGDNVHIAANVVIEAGVVIGARVSIGANSVIGSNSQLADDVQLMPNVTLYHGVTLGARTRIHSGAVIGADGFGYAPDKGVWNKIPQVGGVKIGDDVEIGANTTVDRGALTDTIVGNGVILDNQVQIGHNVVIGDHTAMAGAVAVGGSAIIGKYCQFGGASGVAGHINIVDNVIITGMGMVTSSIKESGVYSSGVGLSETKKWRRNVVRFHQLDDHFKSVRELKKSIQLKDK